MYFKINYMKTTIFPDAIINVLLPIFFGSLIYFIAFTVNIAPSIKNYLPDALWAYSLVSAILIVWSRRIEVFWIVNIFVFAISFEIVQYFNLFPGTGDVIDLLVYFSSFVIGILMNTFFRKKFQPIK